MPSTSISRILIVDDHPLLREGLTQRLQREPDLRVCGEAATAPAAIVAVETHKPDLVIVDISLPGRDGIELTKDLRARFPKMKILVLSLHDESLYAERALRAGASGYLMKHETPEKLIAAVRSVLAGEFIVGNGALIQLLRRFSAGRDSTDPATKLSDRELQVFRLLGQKHSRRQIATMINLSLKTVETHCSNIRRKLGLNDAAALVQAAVEFATRDTNHFTR